jgi:hypothetical protein
MSKAESADLILKLYDLRREEIMRKGRTFMGSYFPESIDDIVATYMDDQKSAYMRMVLSYWDNAAALVNHGAIDEDMFNDMNGEHIFIFCKIYPFLNEIREKFNNPKFLMNLEKMIMRMPDAESMLEARRKSSKEWMEARQAMSKNA